MDTIQFIAEYLIDPLVAAREGSNHRRWLREFEASQYLSADEISQLQEKRLHKLLTHAYANCPFYRERMDRAELTPDKFAGSSDLSRLEVLTKQDIQLNGEEMIAINYSRDDLIPNQTGGSTGAPLRFFLDRERKYSRRASTIRHDRWAGLNIGTRTGVLWGNRADFAPQPTLRTKLRTYLYDRRLILDTSDITKAKLSKFIDRLNLYRPTVYLAYANAIYLFARYLQEKQVVAFHRPESIITSAELLTDSQRSLIEKVFGCPVYNRYGCRETSIIASECGQGDGLHISAETLYLEFVRGDRQCEDGEVGEILVTDLLNFGMPLIRYRIGDTGAPLAGSCSCGRGLPRMRIDGGRITDFLVTPDGRVVSGASLTIYLVAVVPGIGQAQLIQETRERLLVRLVKGSDFGPGSIKLIETKAAELLGSDMRLEFEFVDKIACESSGKYRFSISQVDPLEYLL